MFSSTFISFNEFVYRRHRVAVLHAYSRHRIHLYGNPCTARVYTEFKLCVNTSNAKQRKFNGIRPLSSAEAFRDLWYQAIRVSGIILLKLHCIIIVLRPDKKFYSVVFRCSQSCKKCSTIPRAKFHVFILSSK